MILPVLVLIGILILVNGFLVAMEMALVTARRTSLEIKADGGDHRATQVLAVQDKPGDFLASVQIGITLVGTAASALSGAVLVQLLSPLVALVPGLSHYSANLALVLVIGVITFLTLVFGELVPKRLALQNAEDIAMALTGPQRILARFTRLPMLLLTYATNTVIKLIGNTGTPYPSTSAREIELLVKQGAAEGVLQTVEQKLISGVFGYTERRAQDAMTPRTSIIALDEQLRPVNALRIAKQSGYSRYPVFDDDLDCMVGYVHIKDLIWADDSAYLNRHLRPIHYIPGTTPLPEAFEILAKTSSHMAIVIDEYGGTHGLLTLEDLLEEIVGEIEDEHSPVTQTYVQQSDGEWTIPGQTLIWEVGDLLKVKFQPNGRYKTIAGFMMTELGVVPGEGDRLEKFGYLFQINECDNLRIVEVGVTRVAT
jgi:putative hemolysin